MTDDLVRRLREVAQVRTSRDPNGGEFDVEFVCFTPDAVARAVDAALLSAYGNTKHISSACGGTLGVKTVIGAGWDRISLLPLIVDWHIPDRCLMVLAGQDCRESIRRLYVLDEPMQGHGVLGICEPHHQQLAAPNPEG